MDTAKLKREITRAAKDFDMSGAVYVEQKGEMLMKKAFGFSDRKSSIPMKLTDTYLLPERSQLLLGLSAMLLEERGLLDIGAPLSSYIPEYVHADDVTVGQLFCHSSGIPDFMYSGVMLELQSDPKHLALSEAKRVAREKAIEEAVYSLDDIMDFINSNPLDFGPGTIVDGAWSTSNVVLAAELIERVSGTSLCEFERENILVPCGMKNTLSGKKQSVTCYTSVRSGKAIVLDTKEPVEGCFVTTVGDLAKLAHAIASGDIVSDSELSRSIESIDEAGRGVAFDLVNGMPVTGAQAMGCELTLYIDRSDALAFFHISNEAQKMLLDGGEWTYFRKTFRSAVESFVTYPEDPRLEEFCQRNMAGAMGIRVSDEQLEFVSDVKTALCEAYARRDIARSYVLTDHSRAIGLVTLLIDKKAARYDIDVVQIDERYQGRGYGRIMLQKAIELLEGEGATTLEIGMNRANTPAIQLYKSLGFKEYMVFDEGIYMRRSSGND